MQKLCALRVPCNGPREPGVAAFRVFVQVIAVGRVACGAGAPVE